jgi:hypothetical protein
MFKLSHDSHFFTFSNFIDCFITTSLNALAVKLLNNYAINYAANNHKDNVFLTATSLLSHRSESCSFLTSHVKLLLNRVHTDISDKRKLLLVLLLLFTSQESLDCMYEDDNKR